MKTSLYIRSIPMETKIEDLRDIFSKFGCIKDVYIPRDYYSRVPRGFAYIEFDSVQDAENAVRSSGRLRLFGKELEVEFAVGDRKTPHEMKRRYNSFGSFGGRSSFRDSNRRTSRHSSRFGRSRSRSRSPRRSSRFARSRSRSIKRETKNFRNSFSPDHSLHPRHHYSSHRSRSPRRNDRFSRSPCSFKRESKTIFRSPSPNSHRYHSSHYTSSHRSNHKSYHGSYNDRRSSSHSPSKSKQMLDLVDMIDTPMIHLSPIN